MERNCSPKTLRRRLAKNETRDIQSSRWVAARNQKYQGQMIKFEQAPAEAALWPTHCTSTDPPRTRQTTPYLPANARVSVSTKVRELKANPGPHIQRQGQSGSSCPCLQWFFKKEFRTVEWISSENTRMTTHIHTKEILKIKIVITEIKFKWWSEHWMDTVAEQFMEPEDPLKQFFQNVAQQRKSKGYTEKKQKVKDTLKKFQS